MKNKKSPDVLDRMNYLIGHLEGVKKMIEDNHYCVDIIHQNIGVMSAIKKVNDLILEQHLNSCVVQAIQGRSVKQRETKIKELLRIFKRV